MLITLLHSLVNYLSVISKVKLYEKEKYIRDLKDNFFSNRIKNIRSTIMSPLMLVGGNALGVESFLEKNDLPNSEKSFYKSKLNTQNLVHLIYLVA